MLGFRKQRPDDRLDYDIDFGRWLSEDDTLVDADAVVSDGMAIDGVQLFGQIVKVWVSGGESGKSYQVSVTASTSDGRVKEEAL